MQAAPRQEHRWLERLVGEWTFEGEDQRVFTSNYLGDDGEWHPLMTLRYRRTA